MNMPNDKRRILDEFNELSGDEKHKLISEILSNSNIDLSSVVESMQRAFEHVAKPLIQFAANLSLERWIRGTILKTAEDSLQHGKISDEDAKHLLEQRDEFLSCFDAITGWSDNLEQRRIALTAILSTFAIALHSEVPESVRLELNQELTKPAHRGRQAKSVQEIIELRARDLWERRADKFKDNDHGTAVTIVDAVNADILKLQKDAQKKVPRAWRVTEITIADSVKSPGADDSKEKADKKKAIDRIAHRVKNIVR